MENNEFKWNEGLFNGGIGAGRKPRKRDLYTNPLGIGSETSGIIQSTEDILHQNQETDNAISKVARELNKPAPAVALSPNIPAFKPAPQPSLSHEPIGADRQNGTDRPNLNGSHFHYGEKAYTHNQFGNEKTGQNDKDVASNLTIQGGNEGYTIPAILPEAPLNENRESDFREKEKLIWHSGNEGYTIPPIKNKTEEESNKQIEENTAFLERFFNGNEQQKRFANGFPAEGEAHQSVFGTWLDGKKKSDNATQDDWGKTVENVNHSSIGQGVMDIWHSGAAGGYDLANGITRGAQLIEPNIKKHYQYPWKTTPRYTDPETKIEYEFDPMEYSLYRFRQFFRDESQSHESARSNDFNKSNLTDPAYLGIKVAGTVAQDLPALLGTALFIKNLGGVGVAGEIALGALNGKGKSYDQHMDEAMKKSEEALWNNKAYQEMREAGLSDHEARFAIGTKHARIESDAAALFGAVKAFIASGAGGITRDGTEGAFIKGTQDLFLQKGSDSTVDGTINFVTGKNN